MRPAWRVVTDLQSRQLGLVERNAALQAGLSVRMIERRIASGEWEPVQPRVYRDAASPWTVDQRRLAACLSAGPSAAVSHRTAATLWGVDRLDAEVIEITVSRGLRPKLSDVIVHQSTDLDAAHITRAGPLPITTPTRTLVDLGAVARPWLVRRALEQWLRERKVQGKAVTALLDEVGRKGRRGAGVLRDVIEHRVLLLTPTDSPAEVELANALREYDVDEPAYHHLVRIGPDVFELDFAYPEAKLAIEVDGYGPHSTPEAFEEDRRRRNLLEGEDWRVLAYTPNRIRSRPWAVAAEVKRNLIARRLRFSGNFTHQIGGGIAQERGAV